MKTVILATLSGLLWLGATASVADMHADMQQLAEEKQCLSCHAREDETPRAPGFSSIAAKYSDGEMRDYLVQVVMTGGEEHWGSATMPEPGEKRAEVSEEEANMLVDWILGMHSQ